MLILLVSLSVVSFSLHQVGGYGGVTKDISGGNRSLWF